MSTPPHSSRARDRRFPLHPRLLSFVVESMRVLELGPAEVFEGGLDWVSEAPREVDWPEVARVIDNLACCAGTPPSLANLGSIAVQCFAQPAFGQVRGLFVSPERLYLGGYLRSCLAAFPMVEARIEPVLGGWVRLSVELHPDFRDSVVHRGPQAQAFAHLLELDREMAQRYPTLFGLSEAAVDETHTSFGHVLTIVPPNSRTLVARFTRAASELRIEAPDADGESPATSTSRITLMREHRELRHGDGLRRAELDELTVQLNRGEQAMISRALAFEGLGHRLRTPLQTLVGGLDALTDQLGDGGPRELLETLQACAQELSTSVDDVLDLSRVRDAVGPLRMRSCDIAQLGHGLEAQYSELARAAGLGFEYRVQGELPAHVRCDSRRILQILHCLLANAVAHTSQGRVRLTVGCEFSRVRDEGYWTFEFCVEDTGCGFDFEARASMFEPSEGTLALRREFDGPERMHIGLCAARHIAAAMRGTLFAESEPGRGSRFVLRVRLEESATDLSSSLVGAMRTGLPSKVVLVAGATDWCKGLVSILGELNISVLQVAEAELVLGLIESDREVGMVLVDGNDARSDRRDLVRAVRRRLSVSTPIVAVTRRGSACGRSDWRAAGVDQFMSMPTTRARLEHSIAYWVSSRSAPTSASHSPSASTRVPSPTRPAVEPASPPVDERDLEVVRFAGGPPASRVAEDNTELAVPVPAANGRPHPALRVLLVDDNDINRQVMAMMLGKFGCEVECAENGRAAVEMATRQRYAMIFMDCEMPVMDGFQATVAIRSAREPFCDVPIIATTAYASDRDRQSCRESGMDDFVAKPVSRQRLQGCLDRWKTAKRRGDDTRIPLRDCA